MINHFCRQTHRTMPAVLHSILVLLLLVSSLGLSGTPAAADIQWMRQFGTFSYDNAYGVARDSSGNLYVAGYTAGTFPGQTPTDSYDAYVRKYDPAGTELWTRQFGSGYQDWVHSVAVDSRGNVYVAGFTAGTLPGQASSGNADVFVRKYNSSGAEQWTRQFGTEGSDDARAVAVDSSGNVYVAGYTNRSLPGQTSAGSADVFVRKYNSSGGELWTRQFGTEASESALGVAVDSSGNVYLVGYTNGALPGQSLGGYLDAFVRTYDSSGAELWTRQFGTAGIDIANGVAVDSSGNVYVAGYTEDGLPGQASAASGTDAFVRKYDPSGVELWTHQFGSTRFDEATAVAVDSNDNVYLAGVTKGNLAGTNAGFDDAFLTKIVGVLTSYVPLVLRQAGSGW